MVIVIFSGFSSTLTSRQPSPEILNRQHTKDDSHVSWKIKNLMKIDDAAAYVFCCCVAAMMEVARRHDIRVKVYTPAATTGSSEGWKQNRIMVESETRRFDSSSAGDGDDADADSGRGGTVDEKHLRRRRRRRNKRKGMKCCRLASVLGVQECSAWSLFIAKERVNSCWHLEHE